MIIYNLEKNTMNHKQYLCIDLLIIKYGGRYVNEPIEA